MGRLYERLVEAMHLTTFDVASRANAGQSAAEWRLVSQMKDENSCFSSAFDLRQTVESVQQRLLEGCHPVIYGDYDVDGLTSVSIVYLTLKLLGVAKPGFFIPSRYENGYGLNLAVLEQMQAKGYDLLIATDNGITKRRECRFLADHGIYYVILDHHEEQRGNLPDFGPLGCMYHRNDVSAAFLALLWADAILGDKEFLKELGERGMRVADEATIAQHLDYFQILASLAVFSDCMSLRNPPNLSLAKIGRKLLEAGLKQGPKNLAYRFSYLLDSYQPGNLVTYHDINFSLNSQLNAVARVWGGLKPNWGASFLTETDPARIRGYALKIKEANQVKKDLVKRATSLVSDSSNQGVVVVDLDGQEPPIPSGLTGLIANAVLRQLDQPQPVLVLAPSSIEKGDLIGSLRGPEGLGLDKVLNSPFIMPFLKDHGGHEAACGLTLPRAMKDDFLARLNEEIGERSTPVERIRVRLDEDMVSLSGLADLKSLEPFGTGFELPRMYLSIDASRLKAGLRNGHCFVSLEGGGRLVIFNCEKQVNDLTPGRVEIEGELVANVFRGRTYPEFKGTL